MGTTLGPRAMRAGERPARLCTFRTITIRPEMPNDMRKCVTAIYWGSSGRRFKSCQPDTGQRVFLSFEAFTAWAIPKWNTQTIFSQASTSKLAHESA
jgi:hypothetical protein